MSQGMIIFVSRIAPNIKKGLKSVSSSSSPSPSPFSFIVLATGCNMSSDNCVLFSRGTASVMGGRCWQKEMTEDAKQQLAFMQANWADMKPLWLPNSDISTANRRSPARGGLDVMISGMSAANCSSRVEASAAGNSFDATAAAAAAASTATVATTTAANCSIIKASAAASTFNAAIAAATATRTTTSTTATITATAGGATRRPPQLPTMAGSSCCSNSNSCIPHKAAFTRLLEGPEAACLASTIDPSSSQHQQALNYGGGGGPLILMNNYNSCSRSCLPPSPLAPNFGRLLPHLAENAPPPSHLPNQPSPHDNPSLSTSETCHARLAPANPGFGPNPNIIKNEALDEDVISNSPLQSVKRGRGEGGGSHIKVKGEQVQEVSPKRPRNAAPCKKKEDIKTDEPPKVIGKNKAPRSNAPKTDFIHVRARRGQATDSHSLAERVRREKISERMRFLQDLVPGCNKINGKAMMLDEIINYVQSLQHQVEFLAMKLAALNPRLDFTISNSLEREVTFSMDNGSELNMDIFGNQFLCSDYLTTTQNTSTFYLGSCNDIDVSIRTDISVDNCTSILDY